MGGVDLGRNNIVDGLFTVCPPFGCLAAAWGSSTAAGDSAVRAGSCSRQVACRQGIL